MVGFCQLTQNKPNKLFYFGVIHFLTANKRELITIMLFVSQLHLALRERNNQPKAKKFSFKLFFLHPFISHVLYLETVFNTDIIRVYLSTEILHWQRSTCYITNPISFARERNKNFMAIIP